MKPGGPASAVGRDGVAKYLYGFVQTDREARLEASGLGGSPVWTVASHGLGCVLSDYPGPAFETLSRGEVVRCLLAHQVVVEKAMERHTVLPARFGTLLDGEPQARALLAQCRQPLAQALAQFQEKVEVEVAATWNMDKAVAELARREDIALLRASIKGLPPAEAFQQRLRLGQMVKEALDQRRDSYGQRILASLRPWALDVQPNPLLSDQMVMNAAFLLPRGRQDEFDSQVGRLNDHFQDQLGFRVIGPLPPYSFATVELVRPCWEEIEGARQLLGLSQCLSRSQIREAYRRLAAQAHPDLSPGDGEASAQGLVRLRQASELLLAHCRRQAASGAGGGAGAAAGGMEEPALLVEVRRNVSREVDQARFGGPGSLASREGSYVYSR